MADMDTALNEMMKIDGAIGVALVDYTSGMALGTLGSSKDLDLTIATAGNTDVVRAKFRNSFEKPEAMVPGKVTQLDFVMPDVYHTFRKGHRMLVQVSSSWFPLVDRNPQKFVDIYKATASDFQKATIQVHRSGAQASRITFKVLPRSMTP